MQRNNIAARAGRWSAEHRRAAILGWVVFVVTAVLLGGVIGTKHIPQDNNGTGESGRAQRVLNDQFPQPAAEQVLVQSSTLTVRDPGFRAAVADLTTRLSALSTAKNVRSPLLAANRGEISRDGHSVLVSFQIQGSSDSADKRVGQSLAATAAAQRAHPDLRIEQAGDGSATKALNQSFSNDFAKARTLSLPITLIILILAFGALVAAGIPVLLAITGVGATLGLVALASHIGAMDPTVSEVVLLIGMAVGVDYSLFYMRREREERAAGRDEQAALRAAAATSGRSVLVSGLTVMAAMAGMYLAGDKMFASMATRHDPGRGGCRARLADRASRAALQARGQRDEGRVPFVARRRESGGEARIWGSVVDRVLRRPLAAVLVVGGCPRAGDPGIRTPHLAPATSGPAEGPADRQDPQSDRGGLPGRPAARRRRHPGRGRHRAAGRAARSSASSTRRWPAASCISRSRWRSSPHDVAVVSMPLPARAPTQPRTGRWTRCGRGDPGDRRPAARGQAARSPARPPGPRTSTTR